MRTFKIHTQKPIFEPMKQYTPGPWAAYVDIYPSDSSLNDIRIVEPKTETENLPPLTIAKLNQNMGDEAIANAYLIAAAPEMLDALQTIVSDYSALMRSQGASADIGGPSSPFTAGEWVGSRLGAHIAKAQSIISKARGEA